MHLVLASRLLDWPWEADPINLYSASFLDSYALISRHLDQLVKASLYLYDRLVSQD